MNDIDGPIDRDTKVAGTDAEQSKKRRFVEEIEVAGSNLVERFKPNRSA